MFNRKMTLSCWICQQQETTGLVLLSQRVGTQNTISAIIKAIVGIKLDEDVEIQRLICSLCVDRLNQTYTFWKQCWESQLQQKPPEGEVNEQYCRLCGKHDVDELIALECACDTWNKKVTDMVEFLSGVVIEGDDRLSPYICDICLQAVSTACIFKQQCLEAELSFLSQAVRKWDMMKFEGAARDDLVVDLYTAALPRWNTRECSLTHTYCLICNLETPIHLFSSICHGCRLEFRNFNDIISSASEPLELANFETDSKQLELSNLETDSNPNMDIDFDIPDAQTESDCSVDEEPSALPKKNRPAVVNYSIGFKFVWDIENCIEFVEDLDDTCQRVRRKGPMCCSCKIFFPSDSELEQHREMYHAQKLSEEESRSVCKVCGKLFRNKREFRYHMAYSERDTFYYCKLCEKFYFRIYDFKNHKTSILHCNSVAERAEFLDNFETKSVMRYQCKINGCKKLEKTVEEFQKHYIDRHHLELDKDKLNNDPSFRAETKVYCCKMDGCDVDSISLRHIINHCSVCRPKQSDESNEMPPMTVAEHKSSFKPEAPDIKQFTKVDNIDNIIDVLKTDRECCCGCFTFHETADDLQRHVSAIHTVHVDNEDKKPFPLVCTKCSKGFNAKAEYSHHMSISSGGIYYYCQPCEVFLWDLRDVNRHRSVCPHRDTIDGRVLFDTVPCTKFICCGCSKQFDIEDNLIEHRKNVHGPPNPSNRWRNLWVCKYCHKQYQNEEELQEHQAKFSNTNFYKCKVGECVFETRNIGVIRKHVFAQTHLDASGITVTVYKPQPVDYACCIFSCDFVSKCFADVVKHVADCHANAKSHNAVRCSGRKLFCEACSTGYNTWYQILNHKSKTRSIRCRFCGISMKKAKLIIHRPQCSKKIEVSCDICGRQCQSEAILKLHKKRFHKSRKQPEGTVCSICGQVYSNIYNHMITHSDERPFKCDLCPMGFRYKSQLNNHRAVHTKERAFLCRFEGCDNRYAHSADRFRHERQVHMKIMPHSCSICSKSFGRDRDLRLHQRLHTGRKLYPCNKCNDSFDKLIDLKQHECDDEF
ncbi:zinc finger protein 729-like [Sabethes cyaneus]|uniref:zinc finger protein 729-like n=1 Tax=Sabethes cyaneus TaxID=53552 RepID=UPI00237E6DD9|nr:zinc finger protein 729-like [Sabethes cyaneus]